MNCIEELGGQMSANHMSADDVAGIRFGSWVKMAEFLFQKGLSARSLEHLAWAFFD